MENKRPQIPKNDEDWQRLSVDELKRFLLTDDGVGKQVKEIALDRLLKVIVNKYKKPVKQSSLQFIIEKLDTRVLRKMKQEPKFKIGQKIYYIHRQNLSFDRIISSGSITSIYITDFQDESNKIEYAIGPEDSGYFGIEDKIFLTKKEAEVALQNLVAELEQDKKNLARESKEGNLKKIAELKMELGKVEDAKFVPGPVLKDIEPGSTIWLIDLDREFSDVKIEKDKVEYVQRVTDKKGTHIFEIGSQLMAGGYSIEEINQLPDKNYDELYYMAFGSKELAMANLNFAKKLILEDAIKEFESRL